MTSDQRQKSYEKALAELSRAGKGWVVFADKANGDNYVEVDAELRVEVSHRRWAGSKLPPLGPTALTKLAALGFREAERNLAGSWAGWTFPRMARQLEAIFVEGFACAPAFDVEVTRG